MTMDSAALAPAPLTGGALYCGPDSHLRLTVFNAAAGVTVALTTTRYDPDCGVLRAKHTIVPTTDRLVNTVTVPLGAGWLMTAQLVASAGTPRRGQCFARVELVSGIAASADSLATILQGYVLDTSGLAYPGSPIESSTSGRGVVRSVLGTDPAAGVEISEAVPANARWRLIGVAYTLVASAAVANRTPILTIDDGATILWTSSSAVAVTASQTAKYRAAAGVPFFTVDTREYQLPLPSDLILMGGFRIRTVTGAIDAGDNYGAPQLLVEEWIED